MNSKIFDNEINENFNYWLIADTHFGHKRLWETLNPGSRPGNQDELITKNWHDKVKPGEIIIHMGDVTIGMPIEDTPWLPGKVWVIKGNHDKGNKIHYLRMVRGWKPIDNLIITALGPTIYVTHEPLRSDYPIIGDHVINIHGHTHERFKENTNSITYINICPEIIGYSPVRVLDALGTVI